jgi:transposase
MNNTIIGIDIAKNIFQVCEMSSAGKIASNRKITRSQVLEYIVKLPRGIVAMESCGGSSHWGREIKNLGFEVKLIPAQHVKPFVRNQKNDANDAVAICEAALRPNMKCVTPNTVEQQDLQNLHRVRERQIRTRTSLCNQIRGLLLEYGITIPQGRSKVRAKLVEMLDSDKIVHNQRGMWKQTFTRLYEELKELEERVIFLDEELTAISTKNQICKNLEKLKGVGPITSTALVAAVNDAKDFKNGRQFAAWLGLVPRQESSGGKTILKGITKRGDKYIRKLLVHGARTELRLAEKRKNTWAIRLRDAKGTNLTAVAMANKTARSVWYVLAGKEPVKKEKQSTTEQQIS